jgi:uncharacterized protein (TIGR00106 family)
MEISIYPLDKGESVSPFVARCVDVIDRSGLDYRCNAMGTTVEGELDQLLDVVEQCFNALSADCERIECSIKVDYRKGRQGGLAAKVASVEEKLGRVVKK